MVTFGEFPMWCFTNGSAYCSSQNRQFLLQPSLVPRPALFLVKRKTQRSWYLFSCAWRQGQKGGRKDLIEHGSEQLRYQVTYHTYLASRRQQLPKHWTCSWLNNMWKTLLLHSEFWAICRLCHPHMRKDTRTLFHTASDKSWVGPGNKAIATTS